MKAEAWQNTLHSYTLIPTPSIKIHDKDGHFVCCKAFITSADNSDTTTEVPIDVTHSTGESNKQNVGVHVSSYIREHK